MNAIAEPLSVAAATTAKPLLRVDGWNSLSIHFLASASPAQLWLATASAAAMASAVYFIFIVFSWLLGWW